MKRKFLFLFFISMQFSYAQDTLIFLPPASIISSGNDTIVQVKIIEINNTEIKVKKYSDLSGPDYIILKTLLHQPGGIIHHANSAHENPVVGFKIYTDALGFNSRQPNSIFQSEASLTWKFNDFIKDYNYQYWSFLKIPGPQVRLFHNIQLPIVKLFQVKSDSSFRYYTQNYFIDTISSPYDTVRYIHVLNLIKHSAITIAGKLNIITLKWKGVTIYFDDYASFYLTGVSDTLLADADKQYTIVSLGNGFNLKLRLAPAESHFMMDLSYSWFGLTLLDNDVIPKYGALYYPNSNPKNQVTSRSQLGYLYNSKAIFSNGIGLASIELKYSGKHTNMEGSQDGIYIRANFYFNTYSTQDGVINGASSIHWGNNYTQIQIGVSKNLLELFDK